MERSRNCSEGKLFIEIFGDDDRKEDQQGGASPMRRELEQKLVKRFPTWFNVNDDGRHTLMPFGFQCGDGWQSILWRLCEDLEPMATTV
jgi:hypothetical protein